MLHRCSTRARCCRSTALDSKRFGGEVEIGAVHLGADADAFDRIVREAPRGGGAHREQPSAVDPCVDGDLARR